MLNVLPHSPTNTADTARAEHVRQVAVGDEVAAAPAAAFAPPMVQVPVMGLWCCVPATAHAARTVYQ